MSKLNVYNRMELFKNCLTILFLVLSSPSVLFCQYNLDQIELKRNIRQDNQQFQFMVLDEEKHGIWNYNRHKFYYWYKAQKLISTQGGSSGRLLDGKFEGFYQNKQLSQRGEFKKGLKHGEWLYWREDGTLYSSENWKKGELFGNQKKYDAHGEEIETITITGNRKIYRTESSMRIVNSNGIEKLKFYENGSLIRTERQKDGELHGFVRLYEDGKMISKVKYKRGIVQEKKLNAEAEEETDEEVEAEEKEPFFKRVFKIFKRKKKKEEEPESELTEE
ncbi:MAG: hypothetical protein QNK23_16875 [Crocinitomicaceae bacterium]|nr:hypothetical protein [Crocinitomicaceae bacterium]